MLKENNCISTKEYMFFTAYGLYLVFSILGRTFFQVHLSESVKYIILYGIVPILLYLPETSFHKKSHLVIVALLLVCGFIAVWGHWRLYCGYVFVLWALLFVYKFYSGVERQDLLWLAFTIILALSACWSSKSIGISFLLLYASRTMPRKKIFLFTCVLSSILLVAIYGSTLLSIIPYLRPDDGFRARGYMGFKNQFLPATLTFNIVSIYLYSRGKDVLWREIIVLVALLCFVFWETGTRMPFGIGMFLILFYVINEKTPFKFWDKKWFRVLALIAIPFCAVLSLTLIVCYSPDNAWLDWLDTILERRLEYAQFLLVNNRVHLIGNNAPIVGANLKNFNPAGPLGITNVPTFVDIFYMHVLLRFGVVVWGGVLAWFTMISWQAYKRKEYLLAVIIAAIACYGLIDCQVVYLYFCTFWFAMEYPKGERTLKRVDTIGVNQ